MTAAAYLLPSEAEPIVGMSSRSLKRAIARGEVSALYLPRGSRHLCRIPAVAIGLEAPKPESRVSPTMTVEQVAGLVRVNRRTVMLWAHDGLLPMDKVGGQWRISGSEFRRWLQRHSSSGVRADSGLQVCGRRETPEPLGSRPHAATPVPAAYRPFTVPARWFDCPSYDRCLAHAGREDWPSWSCRGCALAPAGIASTPLTELPLVGLEHRDDERADRVALLMRLKP